MKHLEEIVATLRSQLLNMKYDLNDTISEDNDSTTDETFKRVLEEIISNNEETRNKAEPTTAKFTGKFSYEALEYWANKGRSDSETFRDNSVTIEDLEKSGKHKRYESNSNKLEWRLLQLSTRAKKKSPIR